MPTPLTRLATRLVLLAVLVAIVLPLLPGEVAGRTVPP